MSSSGTVKPRVMCRLSPNEEAALLRQQREERRKARLVQVRQQEKTFAKKVRDNVKTKRQEEKRAIEKHLQTVLTASVEAERRELEARYRARQSQIGLGHRQAQHVAEEENRLRESKLLIEAEQRWQAKQRHSAAMKELSTNQLRELEVAQHPVMARKRALDVEKERAKHVSINKPLPTQPLIKDLAVSRGRKVQLKEAEGFGSTYYNIPSTIVQRVPVHHEGKPTAQEMAEVTTKQDESLTRHTSAAQQEHQEKAWLRHKHALARVKLEREKADVITQLKALEREDRANRQKSLAKMPANMFQHTQRRVEIGCEQQRDMEQAFERIFIKTHGVHSQPKLSKLTSDLRPAHREPTPEDSSSSSETHQLEKNGLPPKHGDPLPPSISHTRPSKTNVSTSEERLHRPPTHSLQRESGTDTSGPSQPSILTLSSDLSSFEQQRKTSSEHKFSSSQPRIEFSPPKCVGPSAVAVPSGEAEPSEQSFDSTTSDDVLSRERSSPLFERVTHSHRPMPAATAAGLQQPEARVTDLTAADLPEDLSTSATTSRSVSSSSDGRTGEGSGVTRPLIKGILKHTAGKNTQSTTPLAPTSKGEGMHKLVAMIRAQHQAWNERLAARASLLQSNISHSQDSAPTLSLVSPQCPPQDQERGGASQQRPSPLPSHDPSVGGASQLYPPPLPSRDPVGGGASPQLTYSPSHEHGEDLATHPYPHQHPHLMSHDHSVGGASTGGLPVTMPSVSQYESLSIYTMSTRDSTRSPELDATPSSKAHLPSAGQGERLDSTLQSDRGPLTPEPLSITQYHSTLDSQLDLSQPLGGGQGSALGSTMPGNATSPQLLHPSPSPPPLPPRLGWPQTDRPLFSQRTGVGVYPRESGHLVESKVRHSDVRVQDDRLSGPPSFPSASIDIASLPAVMAMSVNSAGVDVSSMEEQHTRVDSLPHPHPRLDSPSPLTSASALSHLQASSVQSTVPSHTSNSTATTQFTPANPARVHVPFPYHSGQNPFPFQQAHRAHFNSPLTGSPFHHTATISAIPTPSSLLLSPSPLLLPQPTDKTAGPQPTTDFHQLSFATPTAAQRDTTSGTDLQVSPYHDLSTYSCFTESPLGMGGQQHRAVTSPSHNFTPRESVVDVEPRPEPPPNASFPASPLNTDTGLGVGVVQTRYPTEDLSIVTMETSHTHSEPPADIHSTSTESFDSSLSEEERDFDFESATRGQQALPGLSGQDYNTSPSEQDTVESEPEIQEEVVESESEVEEAVELEPKVQKVVESESEQLEDAVDSNTQPHNHFEVSLSVNSGSKGEERGSTSGVYTDELGGESVVAGGEAGRQLVDPADIDTSDKSADSSIVSESEEKFTALPVRSPGSTVSETEEDVQSDSPLVDGSSSTADSQHGIAQGGVQPLTLQEAFLRRKEQFVRQSQDRLKQLKDNAEKRQMESMHSTPRELRTSGGRGFKPPTPPNSNHHHLNTGSGPSSKGRKKSNGARKRAVTFSSPVTVSQNTGQFSPPRFLGAVTVQPPQFISSQKREKIKKKEMKERNMRFYNRLPEVKRQREEERRRQAYSANRDKAKEYQQKLRVKVKQAVGEKRGTNQTQPPAAKTHAKPKPKRPPFR